MPGNSGHIKRKILMKNIDDGTTETMVVNDEYQQLSGDELKERITKKTIWGEYLYGRKYISYVDNNGKLEGRNDIGSHHFGELTINLEDKTFTFKWDGWDNWTGRAYDVNGEIKFYDSATSLWRTTFKKIEDRKMELYL